MNGNWTSRLARAMARAFDTLLDLRAVSLPCAPCSGRRDFDTVRGYFPDHS